MLNKTLQGFSLLILITLFLSSCEKQLPSYEPDLEILGHEKKSSSIMRMMSTGKYNALGYGFDVTGRYAHENSTGFKVIDVEKLERDHSNRISIERPLIQQYFEDYGENAEQYSKSISQKVNATANFNLFGLGIEAAFNYSNDNSSSFDAKYIYGSYNLLIKQNRYRINATANMLQQYLTPTFLTDLNTLTPQQLISQYGTHVMVDIYTGGKFEMIFQSETYNSNRTQAAQVGIKVAADLIFNVEVDGTNNVNTSTSNQNFGRRLSYSTTGGDPNKELSGQINLENTLPKISHKAWQNSVTPNNSVLVDLGQNGLIPIYELIGGAAKKKSVKDAVDLYLNNGQVKNIYKKVPVYYMSYHKQMPGKWNSKNTLLTIYPEREHSFYVNNGIAFYAYAQQKPGTVAVYNHYSFSNDDSFYTIDPNERLPNYNLERISFYVYPRFSSNSVPVYKYFDHTRKDHYWTLSKTKTDPKINFENKGIDFYTPK